MSKVGVNGAAAAGPLGTSATAGGADSFGTASPNASLGADGFGRAVAPPSVDLLGAFANTMTNEGFFSPGSSFDLKG